MTFSIINGASTNLRSKLILFVCFVLIRERTTDIEKKKPCELFTRLVS